MKACVTTVLEVGLLRLGSGDPEFVSTYTRLYIHTLTIFHPGEFTTDYGDPRITWCVYLGSALDVLS
jgi:hypothetical protein